MPGTLDALGFLALGLVTGFGHCVGMCAPFVLYVSRRLGDPVRGGALAPQAWYTAGRVATYVGLGIAAGAAGSAVELAGNLLGIQRAAAVIAGALLMLYGGGSLLGLVPRLAAGGGPFFRRVADLLKTRAPGHPLLLGLLLGLLPCPPLYSAVLAAAATGSPREGAAGLLLFGLGTAPALLGLSAADELLVRHRALLNRVSQALLLLLGGWFVFQGLRPLAGF